MGHLPRRPMPYTPVVQREYLGRDCLFWRNHGRIEYIHTNEYDRYMRDQHKRIPTIELAAEKWRAAFDWASTEWPEIAAELEILERFEHHPHEF